MLKFFIFFLFALTTQIISFKYFNYVLIKKNTITYLNKIKSTINQPKNLFSTKKMDEMSSLGFKIFFQFVFILFNFILNTFLLMELGLDIIFAFCLSPLPYIFFNILI